MQRIATGLERFVATLLNERRSLIPGVRGAQCRARNMSLPIYRLTFR